MGRCINMNVFVGVEIENIDELNNKELQKRIEESLEVVFEEEKLVLEGFFCYDELCGVGVTLMSPWADISEIDLKSLQMEAEKYIPRLERIFKNSPKLRIGTYLTAYYG